MKRPEKGIPHLIRSEISIISLQDPNTCKERILSIRCVNRSVIHNDINPFEDVETELSSELHSISEMASHCNMSVTSFKKKFTGYYHTSPHRWQTKQRLAHAAELLLTTDLLVKQICLESNFITTSHFIRRFRDEFGLTPKRYREKYLPKSQK